MEQIWGLILGFFVTIALPAYGNFFLSVPVVETRVRQPGMAQPNSLPKGQVTPEKTVRATLQELARVRVVYLAETHDRPSDHQAQLEIIQALHVLHPKLVIGMEMFQRPYQSALNGYLAGQLTETELQQRSQYAKRWGYSWEFYAPVLRFAKAQQLPVIALNVPTEVTRKVARTGLEGLTVADRQWIPPRSAIVLGPESYRQRMQAIYQEMHHGKGNSTGFERFFLAQVLWDETMAEQIVKTIRQSPDSLMVVLVGQGHVLYGEGIPQRVARRMNGVGVNRQRPLEQRSLLLNPSADIEVGSDGTITDYFWYSP
jgi:uncharacterized iron-regulated protein